MTRLYALLGCGKAKAPGPRPAREKYTSDYFRQKREWAEANCERWWVLSAKFGAINPDREIDDYDVTIGDDEFDPERYRRQTYVMLRASDGKWMGDAELHALAGQKYIEPLREMFEAHPCSVVFPFAETEGIGEQRAWLADELEEEPDGEQSSLAGWSA